MDNLPIRRFIHSDTERNDFMARSAGDRIERKYYAHYIDASFKNVTSEYTIIGQDLEALNIELNPEVETIANILGESSTSVKGYQPQYSVDRFFCREDEPIFDAMFAAVNARSTGSALETYVVDILLDNDGSVVSAYRENALLVPTIIGGETDGMQIQFDVYYSGSRTAGTFNTSTKVFTPS